VNHGIGDSIRFHSFGGKGGQGVGEDVYGGRVQTFHQSIGERSELEARGARNFGSRGCVDRYSTVSSRSHSHRRDVLGMAANASALFEEFGGRSLEQ
jgi:hypothetical protein